jgi:hypothetical protein
VAMLPGMPLVDVTGPAVLVNVPEIPVLKTVTENVHGQPAKRWTPVRLIVFPPLVVAEMARSGSMRWTERVPVHAARTSPAGNS